MMNSAADRRHHDLFESPDLSLADFAVRSTPVRCKFARGATPPTTPKKPESQGSRRVKAARVT